MYNTKYEKNNIFYKIQAMSERAAKIERKKNDTTF